MPKVDLNSGSIIVLLGVSSLLGLIGRPAEMGFSVAAGTIGLVFANIDKIRRFKGAGFEAEMREKVAAIIEKETEYERPETTTISPELDDVNKRAVITALGNPRYTWRSVGGIAEETELSSVTVTRALSDMLQLGAVEKSGKRQGVTWRLTRLGRETLAILKKAGNS